MGHPWAELEKSVEFARQCRPAAVGLTDELMDHVVPAYTYDRASIAKALQEATGRRCTVGVGRGPCFYTANCALLMILQAL